jgi:hypothetical protein
MSTENLTLEFLGKNVWWWNWERIRKDGVPGVLWDREAKQAAHHYELMRCFPKGKQHYRKTYLELNDEEQRIVHVLWCNWPESAWRFASEKQEFTEIGWTPVLPNPPVQWNLRLPNDVLTKAFMREIAMQRETQHIRPAYHRASKKSLEPNWKEIQILDRKENDTDKLSNTEWSIASKAMKKAETFYGQFRRFLAQWLRSMRLHKNARPGEEYEVSLDLKAGVKRLLATRRDLEESLEEVPLDKVCEAHRTQPDDYEPIIRQAQFFNFKIVYWKDS